MLSIFKIFLQAPGKRHWKVVLAQLAAGLTEGFGLVTLLPIVTLATSSDQESTSPLDDIILSGLAYLGLEPRLGTLLVVFAVAMTIRSALQMLAMQYIGYAAADVSTDLRRQIIGSLLGVRWRFLVAQPVGRFANALSIECNRAGKCYVQAAFFVAQIVKTTVYVGIAFVVSFEFALAAFVASFAVAGTLHFLVRIARKAGWRQTARMMQLITFLSDTLINIKPIKAMGREGPFGDLLERRTAQLRQSLRTQVVTTEVLGNAQDMLVAIMLSAGFFLAVEVFKVPVAEVLVMGLVIARLISNIGKLQTSFQKAVITESALIICKEIISEAEREVEENPGRGTPSFQDGLVFDRVSFGFGQNTVLQDVSLEIEAGSLTVLTGPSGSGKTTISDLIIGLHLPQSGRILVDGRPLRELDLQQWRQMLAYVPQEQTLLHDSIATNVSLGDQGKSHSEIEKALRLAGAWDFVSTLPEGLETIVGEKGARLSGGQRQRIGLARALIQHPRLLILDEVTSALDQSTALAIAQQIKRISRGMTVLAVTHRSEFVDMADKIYALEDGRVIDVSDGDRKLILTR